MISAPTGFLRLSVHPQRPWEAIRFYVWPNVGLWCRGLCGTRRGHDPLGSVKHCVTAITQYWLEKLRRMETEKNRFICSADSKHGFIRKTMFPSRINSDVTAVRQRHYRLYSRRAPTVTLWFCPPPSSLQKRRRKETWIHKMNSTDNVPAHECRMNELITSKRTWNSADFLLCSEEASDVSSEEQDLLGRQILNWGNGCGSHPRW